MYIFEKLIMIKLKNKSKMENVVDDEENVENDECKKILVNHFILMENY